MRISGLEISNLRGLHASCTVYSSHFVVPRPVATSNLSVRGGAIHAARLSASHWVRTSSAHAQAMLHTSRNNVLNLRHSARREHQSLDSYDTRAVSSASSRIPAWLKLSAERVVSRGSRPVISSRPGLRR